MRAVPGAGSTWSPQKKNVRALLAARRKKDSGGSLLQFYRLFPNSYLLLSQPGEIVSSQTHSLGAFSFDGHAGEQLGVFSLCKNRGQK
jgi:hypothetical protein